MYTKLSAAYEKCLESKVFFFFFFFFEASRVVG